MIVAVAGGKVAETGTHEDLMQKKGIYYQLVMLQSLAEKEATELSELGSVISEQEMGMDNNSISKSERSKIAYFVYLPNKNQLIPFSISISTSALF